MFQAKITDNKSKNTQIAKFQSALIQQVKVSSTSSQKNVSTFRGNFKQSGSPTNNCADNFFKQEKI